MSDKIPVSAVIATKNEEANIQRCLGSLQDFGEVVVVDSNSEDATCALARQAGAIVHHFTWNRRYPKKRQWILENIPLAYDWAFFIDADEVMTEDLTEEMRVLFSAGAPDCAGYFIRGLYVWNGRILKHGAQNNKLALINKNHIKFLLLMISISPAWARSRGIINLF